MFEFFMGIATALLLALLFMSGFGYGHNSVAEHCNDYGKVEIRDQWYECKPLEVKEAVR